MANILKMVTGERYVNNTQQDVYFLGTWQTDGWIYFNDDRFWRYEPNNGILQIFYINKEIWVETNAMTIKTIKDFNVTMAQNNTHGAGAVAENASIEAAVQWAIDKATNEWISYDYTTGSVRDVNSPIYNCSTFVITAFWQAGFNLPTCYNTMTMMSEFIAAGFEFIPQNYIPAEDLLRGDIQIKQYDPYGHTNIYIGENQDVDCGSTPLRILSHTPDNWGRGYGWDGILRYTG